MGIANECVPMGLLHTFKSRPFDEGTEAHTWRESGLCNHDDTIKHLKTGGSRANLWGNLWGKEGGHETLYLLTDKGRWN